MTVPETLQRLRALRGQVEVDTEGLADGITGDNFKECCLELADEVGEREAQAEALAGRIKAMQERKSRIEQSAETLRTVILQAMDINGQKTVQNDAFTLSLAQLQPDVRVVDESLLPSRFFAPQPPKLDKKALKQAVLKDGEIIPGAEVGNGSITLTIRTK